MLMAALVAMVSAGCSTTRRVEKGEILYNGLKGVVYENPLAEELPEGLRDDINDAVDVPGNKKTLMVLPLGLWVYNNMGSHDKGLKKWFYNKFAQEPVVVSEIRPEIRTKMIDEILDNNGYSAARAAISSCRARTSARPKSSTP